MKVKSQLLLVFICLSFKWSHGAVRFLDQLRLYQPAVHPQPLAPPAGLILPPSGAQIVSFPPPDALLIGAPPSAAGPAGPAAPAPAPLYAATPPATTPDPDPFQQNTSIVFGEHPSSVINRNTLQNSMAAGMFGTRILDFAHDVNDRLVNATKAHLQKISPTVNPFIIKGHPLPTEGQAHDNWTEYWQSKRPLDPQWIAPPMTKKIQEWMGSNLHEAAYEVAGEVPQMVRAAILRHTKEMVERMRFKPFPATRPPPVTTTWAPPPAIAPPAAPSAAPAVASPPGAPGAPANASSAEDPEPVTLGMGYIKGPNGQYYAVDLDKMQQTTTPPQMVMGANGRMYALPPGVTKAPMVMGPDGRMYSAR